MTGWSGCVSTYRLPNIIICLAIFSVSSVIFTINMIYSYIDVVQKLQQEVSADILVQLAEQRWYILQNTTSQLEDLCVHLDQAYQDLDIESHYNVCTRYHLESQRPRPVIPCPYSNLNIYLENSVSLVSILTPSRFDAFEHTMEYWRGPMSISLYMDCSTDFMDVFNRMKNWLDHDALDIHVVVGSGEFFPFTYLRNVAINHSKTDSVLLNDVDFVPKWNLQAELRQLISNKQITFDNKQVYIIPAFEFLRNDTKEAYPQNKADLIHLWDAKVIDVFRYNIKYNIAHGPTDFPRWRKENMIYEIHYPEHRTTGCKYAFEPYIIGKKTNIPLYDTELLGRYYDKVSHIAEVYALGFRFFVLPDAYQIHMPHKRPKVADISKYHACSKYVMSKICNRLSKVKEKLIIE